MNVEMRRVGASGMVLDLIGALKLGPAEQMFREQMQQVLESNAQHLAINLAGVTDLDSSGIGALVRAYTLMKKNGRSCTFFGANKRVMMVIKMVRLDQVFDMVEDEASALARM